MEYCRPSLCFTSRWVSIMYALQRGCYIPPAFTIVGTSLLAYHTGKIQEKEFWEKLFSLANSTHCKAIRDSYTIWIYYRTILQTILFHWSSFLMTFSFCTLLFLTVGFLFFFEFCLWEFLYGWSEVEFLQSVFLFASSRNLGYIISKALHYAEFLAWDFYTTRYVISGANPQWGLNCGSKFLASFFFFFFF